MKNDKNIFQFLNCFWLFGKSKSPLFEENPVDDNVLETLKTRLQELSNQLDDQTVFDAIASTPENIMNPVIQGFKTVLNALKNSLQSANSPEFLGNVNNLLAVSEDLPNEQERTEILTLIDPILKKLEAL